MMLLFSGWTESSKEQHLFDFVILAILSTPNFVNTTNCSIYSKLIYLFRWSKNNLYHLSGWDRPRHAGVMLVNFDLRHRENKWLQQHYRHRLNPLLKHSFDVQLCTFKGIVQQNIHILDSQLDHYLWQGDLVSSRRCLFLDNPVDCMCFGQTLTCLVDGKEYWQV